MSDSAAIGDVMAEVTQAEYDALCAVEKAARKIAVWACQLDGNATRCALWDLDQLRREEARRADA